jgi:transcriptional regulator with XRE-family HTH domain
MMKNEKSEKIREKIIGLIEYEFESDAAFERAMGLPTKTVNNWRRGRSASFMKMLPSLCDAFGTSPSELLDIPLSADGGELSEDEVKLLNLYRKAKTLPSGLRLALAENLEHTIKLYISACADPHIKKNIAKTRKNAK